MSEREDALRRRQLRARQAAAADPLQDTLAESRQVMGGPTGEIPEDMFINPTTGQMTSRDMLRNNANTSQSRAAVMGGLQGSSFGFGDEALGGLGFLEGGQDMAKFRMEQARAGLEANREANPYTTGISEIGGALAPAIASAPLAAGKTAIGTLGRGIGIGGAEGSLYGAGSGEGAQGRAESSLKDAMLGSLLGGSLPAVIGGAKGAYRALADPIGGALNVGNAGRSNRALASTVNKSGLSLDDMTSDIARAAQQGQPEFRVMDALGVAGQRRASGIARAGGQSGDDIAEYLAQRQLDQGDRVAGFVEDAFDLRGTSAKRTETALTAGRDATADIAYDAARGNAAPVDVRGALGVIDNRLGPMEGVDIAGDSIDARLARFRKRLSAEATPEGVDSIELSDFDRVLGVKQDVQDAASAAARAGRNNEARELGKLVSELDTALEGSSDLYRSANDGFRESSRVIDAVGQGADMAKPGSRAIDTTDVFNAMAPDQQAAARIGYGDKSLAKIEANASPTANRAKPFLMTKARGEADAIAGDPQLFRDRMLRENQMWETQNRATGGSKTVDNLADVEGASNIASDIGGVARSVGNLNFGDMVANGARMFVPKLSGQNEATRMLMARALMSSDPKAALGPAVNSQGQAALRQRMLEAILRNSGRQNIQLN